MFGRVFTFLAGVFVGVSVAQHYKMPEVMSPMEMWEKAKQLKEGNPDLQNLSDSKELQELMDKLKDMEKKYRRD